jgi:hypothetical protein
MTEIDSFSEKDMNNFIDRKLQLLDAKIKEIDNEIQLIKDSKHDKYLRRCELMDEERKQKLLRAEQDKLDKIQLIEQAFQQEAKTAEEEYRMEKGAIRDSLIQLTLDKLKIINEEQARYQRTQASNFARIHELTAATGTCILLIHELSLLLQTILGNTSM